MVVPSGSVNNSETASFVALLSSFHFWQCWIVCSGESTSSQNQHCGSGNFLILWRYVPKHQCPVRAWVKWKPVSPNFRSTQALRFGTIFLVCSPPGVFFHFSSHLSRVLPRSAIFAVLFFLWVRALSSASCSIGTIPARASAVSWLYATP